MGEGGRVRRRRRVAQAWVSQTRGLEICRGGFGSPTSHRWESQLTRCRVEGEGWGEGKGQDVQDVRMFGCSALCGYK